MRLEPHTRWQAYCTENRISFWCVPYASEPFRHVERIRQVVYHRPEQGVDLTDAYSEHYLCVQEGLPVAALRVTRHSAGLLDCEQFLPASLLLRWGPILGSATRFVALPQVQCTTKIAQLLVEIGWRDQVNRGIRLDVINVHQRAVRYYGKLGYELIADSFFVHPKWNTPSHLMLFPATPHRDTPIRRAFEGMENPLELDRLAETIRFSPWKTFERTPPKEQEVLP